MLIYEEDPYLSIFVFGIYVFAAILSLIMFVRRRSKTLFYVSMSWLVLGGFLLVGALSSVLLDPFLFKVQYAVMLPVSFLFWMAFLDYSQNDAISWKKTGISIGFTVLIFTWVFHPANVITMTPAVVEGANVIDVNIPYEIWFLMISDTYTFLYAGTIAYWGILTYRAAPEEMKKRISAIMIVGIIAFVLSFFLYIIDLGFITDKDLVFLLEVSMMGSQIAASIVIAIIVYKEPRIVHLLPYIVYRLLVTSKTGTPYVEKAWSEHEINAIMVSGLLSAIGSFAKETLKDVEAGTISEIRLRKGILLTEMQFSPVNIAILASKSSPDLKSALSRFSEEFVRTYYNDLYDKDGFPIEVSFENIPDKFTSEKIDPLLDKHFANVPLFIRAGMTTDELFEKVESGAMTSPPEQ